MSAEVLLMNRKPYNYIVVKIYENFQGYSLETNPILQEISNRSGTQRREHFVILVSHRYATNDDMSAFVHSVDLIVNIADLANFKPVLRRGAAQHSELYQAFREMLPSVQALCSCMLRPRTEIHCV